MPTLKQLYQQLQEIKSEIRSLVAKSKIKDGLTENESITLEIIKTINDYYPARASYRGILELHTKIKSLRGISLQIKSLERKGFILVKPMPDKIGRYLYEIIKEN